MNCCVRIICKIDFTKTIKIAYLTLLGSGRIASEEKSSLKTMRSSGINVKIAQSGPDSYLVHNLSEQTTPVKNYIIAYIGRILYDDRTSDIDN